MRAIGAAFVVFMMGMSAGCAINKQYPEVNATNQVEQEAYVIGVGDSLKVSVWRNPDLSVSVPVRPDGRISAPLVGDLKAAGETPEALASSLTEKLGNFIRTPQVTVIVTGTASAEYLNRVRVTGAVNSPQSVPYRKGMTVMDLVLLAGGLTPLADGNNAKLYRGDQSYPLYLNDILVKGDLRSNYELMSSDTLTVPESVF